MADPWHPHFTVAAVIEQDGQFLFGEELTTPERNLIGSSHPRDLEEARQHGCACVADYPAGKRYALDLITHF